MKDQIQTDILIEQAVEEALLNREPVSVRHFRRQLAKKTRELRTHYIQVNAGSHREPQEEWLCDNYYVLERESKQSAADMRKLAGKTEPDEVDALYAVVQRVFFEQMPPICDESVSAVLTAMGKHATVSEKQFSLFPAALKSALIGLAWKSIHETRREDEIAYAITGLGKIPALDMDEIIEQCSSVEQILLQDPAGVYPLMNTESKRYYRHLIASISAATGQDEHSVAREALTSADNHADSPKKHIGHRIINHPEVIRPRRRRGKLCLILQIFLPLLLTIPLSLWAGSFWLMVLCYLPLQEILRTLIWQFGQAGVDVDFLPRMDLKKMEDKPKTIVLVSTLLPKASEAPQLVSRLEQLYFSNSDPDMYYCILADFPEYDYPVNEQDDSQIRAVKKIVEKLNRRYDGRFMLFLRARTWNKGQNKYSGWERKRGAITEFVRFLKQEKTSVHTFVGDKKVLPDIRFLIALDADTSLLYESAQTLVSVAMHPLNRPVTGRDGVVQSGYGILCPKISTDLGSARASAFSRVLSGCGGVTAYETRDKDFYQDLFGESIFAGKGLIHVDSFHEVLSERFPDNQVLSHDILEGSYLRCAFVSDVEMTDTAPSNMSSWLSRLHRWIRGDWQNIKFIASRYTSGKRRYENPISVLSRFKLFDNLRRSLTGISALLCLIAALVAPSARMAAVLALTGVLAVCFASLWAAGHALLTGGLFTLSRKFFTRTLPHTMELIAQSFLFLIMLPAQAIVSLDAVVRSLWRTFISKKNMMEWTTAAQSEMRKITPSAALRRFALPEVAGLLYLIAARNSALIIVGLLFALILPVAYYTGRPTAEDGHTVSNGNRDELLSYNAAMWRYYEEFADAANHWLPPDNIQQSPVFRVASRTSPTNIGLMLLSTLAARDFGFIDTNGLYERIDRTLSSVEKLKTFHGNLYNWYDNLTLDTLKPEFVSSVDSGNFICCLVALEQGIREFIPRKPAFEGLATRIRAIIDNCDLTVFYDKRKHLFSIGWEVEKQRLVDSHYDFLMSEARLTSYYAVARKIVGKKHWGRLGRAMSRNGAYAGPVSWTGTMFEYFMPHLLLPVYDGSLLGEALTYCLYCQKRRVRKMTIPWGISESSFYAFDNNLNYQYKAHGVQKIGVKRYLDRELVISPYSTFITIPFNPNSSIQNLRRLRELGVYGRYGFYEAVDFTPERVGRDSLAVIRSYMAHHIGMSMVASCNALFDNKMQERFMRDHYMKSASEFLQEKIAKNTVIFDELKGSENRPDKTESRKAPEESADIRATSPRCVVLSNGELTDVLTDTGAGYLKFGNADLTRRSTDLLRRAQGFFVMAKAGDTQICATAAPFYDPDTRYSMTHLEQGIAYYAEKKDMEAGLRCLIHPTISCQQRQIAIKNKSSKRELVQVLVYFEPVLSAFEDYNAHPAYSKLFVTAEHDAQTGTIIFKRRNRDSSETLFLTVGFLQDMDFTFETSREQLMRAPNGLSDLPAWCGKQLSNNDGGVPDACLALSFDLLVNAGSQQSATLLICASRSRQEGIENIISMRKIGVIEPRSAARSPLVMGSLEERLGRTILGELFFSCERRENIAERCKNNLSQSALWHTGISGDLPIALIARPADLDESTLESYIRLHSSLRALNVEFDLVLFFEDEQEKGHLLSLVERNGSSLLLHTRGGIFMLDQHSTPEETRTLIYAVARHIATRLPHTDGDVHIPFRPVALCPSTPAPLPEAPELRVHGGVFENGTFYVDRTSPLPYSHILANASFGTLLSDSALGYTWAVNARENKLTPWYNDICTDNGGELCILSDANNYYDLISGSRAAFSESAAAYTGSAGSISHTVTVTIDSKACAKIIDVTLHNRSAGDRLAECAFYIEPVLGVNRETARYVRPEILGRDVLVLENPYNSAVPCCAALRAQTEGFDEPRFMTDRAAFLSGDWSAGRISVENDPCAAVIIPLQLPSNRDVRIRFILAYGETPSEAARAAKQQLSALRERECRIEIDTPDAHLNQFFNHFAPHQILHSRILGRCAFYQCGGAFGFRDQLQDVCAWLLVDPLPAREQIIRCCSVQFEEGDVLHWWHDLPETGGGLRGVRTRFSDDLLWLPWAVADYVEKTGDRSILDVQVPYLRAPLLEPGEHERYIQPSRSDVVQSVFYHCLSALEKGWNPDARGLPLIGCGDWNDGFSSVGIRGKGSSVWLALFLSIVLRRFSRICLAPDDKALRKKFDNRARSLLEAVDEHCWDGSWYIRAFYDDGTKMGTHTNGECAIDLLPQSFAVLAGMPDEERVHAGMESAWNRLVDRKAGIVKLFDEPFHDSDQKPGYVRAYPPGIRENGGQYTHSAIWFAMALLESGDVERGWEILSMLNPVARASNKELARVYKLEPYYMAADIYANPDAMARGGWSMYTGAASWYYRAILESLLGLEIRDRTVRFAPRLPTDWTRVRITATIYDTGLHITIARTGKKGMTCDGEKAGSVRLDGKTHSVVVSL